MSKFIDVTADKWYSKDVDEIVSILVDGDSFYKGIPYNTFKADKEAVDYEVTNTVSGRYEYFIPFVVNPTVNNPLIVYVDGVSTAIDEIIPNQLNGKTYVKLKRSIGNGSVVRFQYSGEPKYVAKTVFNGVKLYSEMSTSGNVLHTANIGESFEFVEIPGGSNYIKVKYGNGIAYIVRSQARVQPEDANTLTAKLPSASLIIDNGYSYEYSPFEGTTAETVRFNGVQLKRVDSKSAIKEGELEYSIEDNKIYTGYVLNNETLEVSILQKNSFGVIKPKYQKIRVKTATPVYYDRFFPEVSATKAEIITSLAKLKRAMYSKFTDSDYTKDKATTSRFYDVSARLSSGSAPWWWDFLRDLENLKTSDGKYVVNGDINNNINMDAKLTRAELADLVDRFRIWCIEALK